MTNGKTGQKTSLVVLLHGILTRRQSRQAVGMIFLLFFFSVVEVIGLGSVLPFIAAMARPAAVREKLGLDPMLTMIGIVTDRDFQIGVGALLIVVFVFKSLAVGFGEYLRFLWSCQLGTDLSMRLLKHYMSQDYSYFLNVNVQNLNKNITWSAGVVIVGVVLPLLSIISETLVGLMLYAMLLTVNVKLTLIASIILPLLVLPIYGFVKRNVDQLGLQRDKMMGHIYQDLGSALTGIKIIKMLEKAEYFVKRIFNHYKEYTQSLVYYYTVGSMPRLALECVAVFGVVVALMVMLLVQSMTFVEIIPVISLYAVSLYRLMPSINRIITSRLAIKYSRHSLEVVWSDLGRQPATLSGSIAERTDSASVRFMTSIALRNISFRYNYDQLQKTIDKFTMEIRKGQTIGIVGASGSGKTTVVDILLGLLFPEEGAVLVDERPLTRADMRAWHALIGYIPQDIFLYDESLLKNVAFGVEDTAIDRDAVKRAIRAAQLEEFVNTLPAGLDTVMGDRGIRLSGGQRQRVGIARALYRDPEILVFDEATSSLDSLTEREIERAIERLGGQKTIIIIAHRLTTVMKCDKLYLMDEGRITASGTYEELLEQSPTFQRLALA